MPHIADHPMSPACLHYPQAGRFSVTDMTQPPDALLRFLLPAAGVRGVAVRLDETWQAMASRAVSSDEQAAASVAASKTADRRAVMIRLR